MDVKFLLTTALICGLPALLVYLVVTLCLHSQKSEDAVSAAYAEFAKRVGGQLIAGDSYSAFGAPQEVRFLHGKVSCSLLVDVEVTSHPHSDREDRTYSTRVRFALDRPATFTCLIVPQGLPRLLAGLLQRGGIHLGWDHFEHQFIVNASDELRAPDILCRGVQEQLLAIRQAAAAMSPLDHGHVTLEVREDRIEVRMKGFLDEVEQLWPFYQLSGRLFDLLGPRV
jgi:hypothetical protein